MLQLTNFIANKASDLGNIMLNKTTSTLTFPSNTTTFNKQTITYKNPTIIKTNDIVATMDGFPLNGDQLYTFGPQTQRRIIITGTATNYVIQSTDGVNCYGLGTGIGMAPWAAASSDSLFLVGGSVSSAANISYSYDGITYNSNSVSTLIGTGSTTIFGIGYNGKQWIAGGNGATTTTNSILYSYDGINWVGAGTVGGRGWTPSYNGFSWIIPTLSTPYLAYSNNGINWTTVTGSTGFSGIGADKCLAWNGVLWLVCGNAIGTNGQCLAYTTDATGATGWTFISLLAYNISGSTVWSVIWNGKMFLATGWNGSAGTNAYSYNGINWTTYTAPFSSYGRTLVWTGNMWIHSGNNKIIYSFDGINWNDTGATSLASDMYASTVNIYKPHSITFQRNLTIATGLGTVNRLASSLDGITWTGLGLTTMFTTRGLCARYNGRLWIAGGEGGNTLAYSYDGLAWNGLGSNTFTQACFDIVWNGTLWVGCGRSSTSGGNTLAYSYDGLTWITNTSSSTCFLPSNSGGQRIVWNGYIWVAIGDGNPNTAYSYDGITWIPNHISSYNSIFRIISTNGYIFLLGGDNSQLYYSYDGLTWSPTTISTLTTIRGMYWYNNMWVISGKPSSTFCFIYSYDGLNWLTSPSSNIFIDTGLFITHNGTVWIATGSPTTASTNNTLAYSYNGINWIGVGSSIYSSYGFGVSSNYQVKPIPYIQHPAVAVGEGGNTIAYSETGINWKGLGSDTFSKVGNTVSWNGSIWVAGGEGTNTLAYSQDGLNWSPLGSSVFTNSTNALSWNNSYWVAGGQGGNTLAYSVDGITWTGVGSTVFTNQGYRLIWNGQTWIAGGQGSNTIAYSTNSITWTGLSGLPLNTYVKDVATNGPLSVAAGLGTLYTLAYTLDPSAKTGWTGINKTIFSTSANGICWNGTIWVAVGEGTNTIAYSYTGISGWIGVTSPLISTRGLGVCWNGVRFIAVGQGTNSIAYSQNGINWYRSYNGFSTGSTTQIFNYGNCVSSNSTIGSVPIQSQLVLNKNIGSILIDTLEVVSSDPYYQTGFDNVSIKIEPNNIYNINNNKYIPVSTINYIVSGSYIQTTNSLNGNTILTFSTIGTASITFYSPRTVLALIVGGGGGGGWDAGGGGGSGGVLLSSLSVISSVYTITVGGGGGGATTTTSVGTNGGNSVFGSTIAYGGGGGSTNHLAGVVAGSGGSGGGRGAYDAGAAGLGTAGQGNAGGGNNNNSGGGGGGPAGAGLSGTATLGGNGGGGFVSDISGSSQTYGGGGGGGNWANGGTPGIAGGGLGGGNGGNGGGGSTNVANNGTGYGGGGGGMGYSGYGAGSGFKGLVILSFIETIIKPTGTYSSNFINGYTVLTFTGSGSLSININNVLPTTFYYLVVAGGGAGGIDQGGGGGAGGLLQGSVSLSTTDTIAVTVGNGGAGSSDPALIQSGGTGKDSSIKFNINTINDKTSKGGGYGGEPVNYGAAYGIPGNGGSSGGVGCGYPNSSLTNTSSATPEGQGNKGGNALSGTGGAGGGGAGAVGGNGNQFGGAGGDGKLCTQFGIFSQYPTTYWAGGGGGGTAGGNAGGAGGKGGGGGGGTATGTQGAGGSGFNSGNAGSSSAGGNGGTNTGGGGGGRAQSGGTSGTGGSGIVVIAYYGR